MTRIVFDRAALTRLFGSEDGPVAKDLRRRGLNIQAAARRSLRQAGTGRLYQRDGHVHVASAPGQPPSTDTGRLAASITEELARDDKGLVERIGSEVEYTLPLERGTRFMEPRPFLLPALQQGGRA